MLAAGVAELLSNGESPGAVDEWVAANVSPAALAEPPFVRAFMLGVLRGTIPDPAVRPDWPPTSRLCAPGCWACGTPPVQTLCCALLGAVIRFIS